MKKTNLFCTALVLLAALPLTFYASCSNKDAPGITSSGTAGMHVPPSNEFYHYLDSTLPCLMTADGMPKDTLQSITFTFSPCLFPVVCQVDAVVTCPAIHPETRKLVTGTKEMQKVYDDYWPEITMADAPWNR